MASPIDAALSGHARSRMQQRGIGAEAVECLLEFGREAFDHHGHVLRRIPAPARGCRAG